MTEILGVLFVFAIIYMLFEAKIRKKMGDNSSKKTKSVLRENITKDWKGLLLIAGIGLCLYAFFMDTSVEVPGGGFMGIDRVNNIGLMNDRMMYFIVGIAIVFGSIMIIVLGQKNEHKKTVDQTEIIAQLNSLNALKEKGAISEEEYQELKNKLLNSDK